MQADSSDSDYRPATPDSPLASSLDHATSTIDDLTLALTNFSRVPSPEPQKQICCCCGSEECDATKGWLAFKSKLESRLVLSAEVGSALLQRHEAYVRRHELSISTLRKATRDTLPVHPDTDQAEVDAPVTGLLKENAVLEKQLRQALLNTEVAEVSNKTLLQELEEAHSTISRLNGHHVRTMGLDTRLSAVLQENDDMRQERDSQTQRAKLAEARLAALKDRTDKLQAEVRRSRDILEMRREERLESSDSLLQDVHSRLEGLQISHVAKSAAGEDPEVIKVIESLVADNEMLKADNKELYKLLLDSREDLQALQREMGEQSIAPPIRETPSKHSRTSSGPSSFKDSVRGTGLFERLLDSSQSFLAPRDVSLASSRDSDEPLTPETGRRPLSPADSLLAPAAKYTGFIHPQPRYPPSRLCLDTDNEPENDQGLLHPYQATKAVQTNQWLGSHGFGRVASTFADHSSPHDSHSDSSSLLDGTGSPMSSLLERVHSLLQRMIHADALTLTNRLKRQHLRGADVKHLSRSTVDNILSDVSYLRAQYRVWLEDEKMTTLCTRKDLRGLFKLFKEVLEEMGQMRVTLNDVILEPAIAVKVSEIAMDPAKAEAMEKERKAIGVGSSWIAPFSKLFGSLHDPNLLPSALPTTTQPSTRDHGNVRIPRPVPKTGPALGASATTVNVEFSGIGSGKSVTSVFSAHPNNEGTHGRLPLPHPSESTQTSVRSVMGIFAGAPYSDDTSDPWVVLPRAPPRVQSIFLTGEPAETCTISRSGIRKRKPSQLPRDVDAILVASSVPPRSAEGLDADDIPGSLLDRTLRRRGLSDSSIHSTFMNKTGNENSACATEPTGLSLERRSMLRTLSRTMQNFKQVATHTMSGAAHVSTSQSFPVVSTSGPSGCRAPSDVSNSPRSHPPPRVPPPTLASLIPNLTSWAAAGAALDSTHPRSLHGALREYGGVPRLFGREGQGRDI